MWGVKPHIEKVEGMKYEKIKARIKEGIEKLSLEEAEELVDELYGFIASAERGEKNAELASFMTDVEIYGKVRRQIPKAAEPRVLLRELRDYIRERR